MLIFTKIFFSPCFWGFKEKGAQSVWSFATWQYIFISFGAQFLFASFSQKYMAVKIKEMVVTNTSAPLSVVWVAFVQLLITCSQRPTSKILPNTGASLIEKTAWVVIKHINDLLFSIRSGRILFSALAVCEYCFLTSVAWCKLINILWIVQIFLTDLSFSTWLNQANFVSPTISCAQPLVCHLCFR